MAVLGSRVQYCIEETVRKSENLLDDCAKLCENGRVTIAEKKEKQAQAMLYDYNRARTDYVSIMEDLALNDDIDEKDVFFVNNTVYKNPFESSNPSKSKKKSKKRKLKRQEEDGIIYLDDFDEDEEESDDDEEQCIPYQNSSILEGHPDLRRNGPHFLWDIEDLVRLGREVNGCPYFASRALAKEADVVFCPYNYLIDPSIKASLNIDLDNDIVIIDEAHNIENVCRDAGSFETTYPELKKVQVELLEALGSRHLIHPNKTVLDAIDKIIVWLTESDFDFSDGEKSEKLLKCWSARAILPQLEEMGITRSTFNNSLKPAVDKIIDHYNKQSGEDKADGNEEEQPEEEVQLRNRKTIGTRSVRILEKFVLVLGFIFDSPTSFVDDYIMGVLRKKPATLFGRAVEGLESVDDVLKHMEFCLWTMNPGIIFNQISKVTHSVILTSGTLTPMETFVSELQADFPVKLVADHVINGSQVWAGVIPTGPNNVSLNGLAKNTSQAPYQHGVCEALYNIACNVPYGVLCFFSSYRVMFLIINYMKQSGLYESLEKKKQIFIEPRNVTAEVFNKELNRYYKCIKDAENKSELSEGQTGGFFFAVYRGKVSEGIDFNNNNCRAVCCLSIPFPNFGDALVKLKQNYNNTRRSKVSWNERNKYLSGYEWYEIQGYRALNQALGRCIRHRKDWGAVILLETRFDQTEKRRFLSNWVESLCHVHYGKFSDTMGKLKSFMDVHTEKDREERSRLRLEHPEEYNHWDDCIGTTRIKDDLDLLIKEKIKKDPFDDDWDTFLGNVDIKKCYPSSSDEIKRERTFDEIDLFIGLDKVDVKDEPLHLDNKTSDLKEKQRATYRPEDVNKLVRNMKAASSMKQENHASLFRNDSLLDTWGNDDKKPTNGFDDDDVICISDSPPPSIPIRPPTLKREATDDTKMNKKIKYEIIEID
ncbi:DNA repair helicase [Backusella circina FSU 941]|nr:DNA repair helicase [Backusella circina FSU 941]